MVLFSDASRNDFSSSRPRFFFYLQLSTGFRAFRGKSSVRFQLYSFSLNLNNGKSKAVRKRGGGSGGEAGETRALVFCSLTPLDSLAAKRAKCRKVSRALALQPVESLGRGVPGGRGRLQGRLRLLQLVAVEEPELDEDSVALAPLELLTDAALVVVERGRLLLGSRVAGSLGKKNSEGKKTHFNTKKPRRNQARSRSPPLVTSSRPPLSLRP